MRDGLTTVYRYARDFYLAGDDGTRGCFLIGTAITDAKTDAEVRNIVEATMSGFTFAERVERRSRWRPLNTCPGAPAQGRSRRCSMG